MNLYNHSLENDDYKHKTISFLLALLFSIISLFISSKLNFSIHPYEKESKSVKITLVELPSEKPSEKIEKPLPKIKKKENIKPVKPKPQEHIKEPVIENKKLPVEEKPKKEEKPEEKPVIEKKPEETVKNIDIKQQTKEEPKQEIKQQENIVKPQEKHENKPEIKQSSSNPNPNELSLYLSKIKSIVESKKSYPERAKRFGIEGDVTLFVKVDSNGKIISVEIYKSSGSQILDDAAMEILNRIKNFPPPPGNKDFSFNLNINYKLEE